MGVFFGGKKYKINLDGVTCLPNLILIDPSKIFGKIFSSDDYILRDRNGMYLKPKLQLEGTALTTTDDCILQDFDGLYLTIKEEI